MPYPSASVADPAVVAGKLSAALHLRCHEVPEKAQARCGCAKGLHPGRIKTEPSTAEHLRRIEEESRRKPCLCPRRSTTLSTSPWSRWSCPASMGSTWSRCRVCRNDKVRKKVNDLLASGASYAMILRALGEDNAKLDKRDRVTIDSVRNHCGRRGVTQTSKVQKLGIYPKRSLRSLAVSSSGPAFSPLSPTRRSGGRPSYCGDIIRAGARATSGNSPGSTPIRNRTAPQLCARASWKAPSSRRNITSRAFALRATSPQPRLRKPRRLS